MSKSYTPLQAIQKIQVFCAFQERCHYEVKCKLYEFGLLPTDVDNIIVLLIEDNFLNEERFAKLFVGGKFRIKQWGRVKIQYELKSKLISPNLIKIALLEIDEDLYMETLTKLYSNYISKLKGLNKNQKKIKVKQHFLQKGYELQLINEVEKAIQDSL